MINKIIIAGRIAAEPELKYTQAGTALCSFSIAHNKTAGDREYTYFVDVTTWSDRAERFCQNCHKGDKVVIEGELRVDKYTDRNGENRTRTYIVADWIEYMQRRQEPRFDSIPDEEAPY